MEFLEKNGRWVILAFAGFVVIGAVIAFLSYFSQRKEEQAQEKLAQIEFEFTRYKQEVATSLDASTQNVKDKNKPETKATAADAAAKIVNMRSQLVTQLNQFIQENPKTIASRIATLYLSELFLNDNKKEQALEILKKSDISAKDLTSILIQKKIASLLADNNQCDEALKIWDQVLTFKASKFAANDIKIMQSLCYQKLNNPGKAEEVLLSIKNDGSEEAAGYSQYADRILKLIQFKKAAGS